MIRFMLNVFLVGVQLRVHRAFFTAGHDMSTYPVRHSWSLIISWESVCLLSVLSAVGVRCR